MTKTQFLKWYDSRWGRQAKDVRYSREDLFRAFQAGRLLRREETKKKRKALNDFPLG